MRKTIRVSCNDRLFIAEINESLLKNIDSLETGDNELILEISEKQFEWGFIAQLENLKGVEIINQ